MSYSTPICIDTHIEGSNTHPNFKIHRKHRSQRKRFMVKLASLLSIHAICVTSCRPVNDICILAVNFSYHSVQYIAVMSLSKNTAIKAGVVRGEWRSIAISHLRGSVPRGGLDCSLCILSHHYLKHGCHWWRWSNLERNIQTHKLIYLPGTVIVISPSGNKVNITL